MQRWSKWAIIIAIIALLGSSIAYFVVPNSKQQKPQTNAEQKMPEFKPFDTTSTKVVATYEGGKITEGELNTFINFLAFVQQPYMPMMLNDKEKLNSIKNVCAQQLAGFQYISSKVGNMPAYMKKADQTVKQFEEQMKAMATPKDKGKAAPKTLEEMIKGKGFTLDQFRKYMAMGDHQKTVYFDSKLKALQYDKVKVQHILIGTQDPKRSDADAKKRADEVMKKINAGGDFTKLAKEYSDDKGSKALGGIIEGSPDQFVKPFADACRNSPLNKVTLVKTEYGYHIMKVLDRKKDSFINAPEQQKQLKEQELFQQLVNGELKFKSLIPQSPLPKK